jgi:V/A-type H+-transporting ATPase subunit E
MSGLDKMSSQILDEAVHLAEEKVAKAKEKAEEMIKKASEDAKTQAEILQNNVQEEMKNYAQRVESSSEIQRKQEILRVKQEIISEVLENSYNKIMKLDTESYFNMIRKMLDKYILPGKGIIYFSKKDLERMSPEFVTEIQSIASSKGSTLELSKEAGEMEGGFVLVYGGIEENCTIRAIFDAQKDDLADKVHRVLFS